MISETIAKEINDLEQKISRYERSIEFLTEQLETKAKSEEQLFRDLEKAHEVIVSAGLKMEKNWGAHRDTLPNWAIDLIKAAKRLEGEKF